MIRILIYPSILWLLHFLRTWDASLPCISEWSFNRQFTSQEPSEDGIYLASTTAIVMSAHFHDCLKATYWVRIKTCPPSNVGWAPSLARSKSMLPVRQFSLPVLVLIFSWMLAVNLRYWRTHFAGIRWMVKCHELNGPSTVTGMRYWGKLQVLHTSISQQLPGSFWYGWVLSPPTPQPELALY